MRHGWQNLALTRLLATHSQIEVVKPKPANQSLDLLYCLVEKKKVSWKIDRIRLIHALTSLLTLILSSHCITNHLTTLFYSILNLSIF